MFLSVCIVILSKFEVKNYDINKFCIYIFHLFIQNKILKYSLSNPNFCIGELDNIIIAT